MASQQQLHMDRLSTRDAELLSRERRSTHLHVGEVAIFSGPSPGIEDLLRHLEPRLGLVPRFRQKIAQPVVGSPLWVDDASFHLEYHVRHTALPPPGDGEDLRRLTARIFSQQLDPHKPLWELWLVDGLEGGRFALIGKTHSVLIDGVAGVDILTITFDDTAEPSEHAHEHWLARPEPTSMELTASALEGWVRGLAAHASRALDVRGTLNGARERVAGAAERAEQLLRPVPPTPLQARIGEHRRVEFVATSLEDHRTVKNVLGVTVNDVVLSAVAGAVERFLEFRGEPISAKRGIRVCTPLSTDTASHEVTQVVVTLPIDIPDPIERLANVHDRMGGAATRAHAVHAEEIIGAENFAPPTILAQASRLAAAARNFDLLVTNVPGPQREMSLLGRPMEAIYPVPLLVGEHALSVGVMSYNGGVYYGLLGDYDAMPDIVLFAEALSESLSELFELAFRRLPPEGQARGEDAS
jgi:WS/DGAT/MGAT family acyltransferase